MPVARSLRRTASTPGGEAYSAFIDLVGTKDRAKTSPEAYRDSLRTFNERLLSLLPLLDEAGARVYFFSDCAFVEAAALDGLWRFLVRLRLDLVSDGLFFKASATKGPLEPVAPASVPELRRRDRALAKRVLQGFFFGDVAAELYSEQERLKGVGIFVSKALEQELGARVAYSCFIPDVGTRRPVPYVDLRLTKDELDSGNYEVVVREAFRAKARAPKLGRYYLSMLILYIRSEDLRGLLGDADRPSIASWLLSGRLERLLGDLVGFDLLHFALLDELEKIADQDEAAKLALETVIRRLVARNKLRLMDQIPVEILSWTARESCLKRAHSVMLNTPRGRR